MLNKSAYLKFTVFSRDLASVKSGFVSCFYLLMRKIKILKVQLFNSFQNLYDYNLGVCVCVCAGAVELVRGSKTNLLIQVSPSTKTAHHILD